MNAAPHRPHGPHGRSGFTLVELLSAMTVLALIVAIVAQVTSTTLRTTRVSNHANDTGSQARLVFGRIGADLAAAVRRPDFPFQMQNVEGGTAGTVLSFFSGVASPSDSGMALSGASSNRGVSLVTYQLAPHLDNASRLCLSRAGKALAWGTVNYFGLDSNGLPVQFSSAGLAGLLPQPGDFDIVSPGVIRLVIGFQLYPDNAKANLLDGSVIDAAQGQVVYSPPLRANSTTLIDLTRISALVVGIVVIDLDSLRLLNIQQVNALAAAFQKPNADTLPAASWNVQATHPDLLPAAIPLAARQALRVFECAFPITPYGAPL